MRYGNIAAFQTGVAIPLFALRSAQSEGIGDFRDLLAFGRWVADCGLDLIQLLPINDTGEEFSPYSARSAFALNPVYIRISNIAGAEKIVPDILGAAKRWNALERVPYLDVVRAKRAWLRQIFDARYAEISENPDFNDWIEENSWVRPYAVYCLLKTRNGEASWKEWKEHRDPKKSSWQNLWSRNKRDALYHAWMQFEAERQLCEVVAELEKWKIRLKGDIPILINEDSADVWADRDFFDLSHRAGAPPDMFSHAGQNWGFPTYRWDVLKKNDYSWWRRRLGQASKFYHAYRIDHVLGFFRIWMIPDTEVTGILGRFHPAYPITAERLRVAGIPDTTVEYLTHPNYPRTWLESLFEGESPRVLEMYFDALGDERYKMKSRVYNEKAILGLPESQRVRDALLRVYWNRIFIPSSGQGVYWPFWYWYDAPVLKTLPQHEQNVLRLIIEENEASQESLWGENGLALLKVMAEETDMLVCAEDLGVIPDCVPIVLKELGILSLRIERWARRWKEAGQPYIAPADYPRLSVATTSCHDTSTLQGWWLESDTDREGYWKYLGGSGSAPSRLMPEHVFQILDHLMQGNSLLVIPAFQDFFALSPMAADRDPVQDRVNIPGTVGPHNWTWRMPVSIEDLARDLDLRDRVLRLVERRKQRPMWSL